MGVRVSVLGILLAVAAFPLTVAWGQGDPIRERQVRMKDMQQQMEQGVAMAKGQVPFDAAKAADIFAALQKNGTGFVALFPAGSDAGETKALPAIWQDRAGFAAADAAFLKAVAAVDVSTPSGLSNAIAAIGRECRACHQNFKSR